MNELKSLIGAKVNYVRFSYQVDINFIGGKERDRKYANLQIEVPFQLKTETEALTIEPNQISTLAPMIQLLHTSLANIELSSDYELSLEFDNGYILHVKPVQKYEAWNLTGDGLPYFVATGI